MIKCSLLLTGGEVWEVENVVVTLSVDVMTDQLVAHVESDEDVVKGWPGSVICT